MSVGDKGGRSVDRSRSRSNDGDASGSIIDGLCGGVGCGCTSPFVEETALMEEKTGEWRIDVAVVVMMESPFVCG